MRRIALALALVTLLACGCAQTPHATTNEQPSPSAGSSSTPSPSPGEPQPRLSDDSRSVDAAGGRVTLPGVTVDVPAGAVAAGHSIKVRTGNEIGRVKGPYAEELAGLPLAVEHDLPLRSPLTLSWNMPNLTVAQRATVVLARWNETAQAWAYTSEPPAWQGNVLTAKVRDFSILTWFADIGQTTGQITGTRVGEPKCSGNRLPSWVTGTVDPDQDLAASAIRVCFEPDKDSRVTVRIANNRTFSQQMSMVDGGQRWAWTWPGADE